MMYGNMSGQTQLICFKKPMQFCIMPYFVKHPKPVATALPYDGLQLPWDGLSSTAVGGRSIVKNRARCGESRFATTTMRNSWQYVKRWYHLFLFLWGSCLFIMSFMSMLLFCYYIFKLLKVKLSARLWLFKSSIACLPLMFRDRMGTWG